MVECLPWLNGHRNARTFCKAPLTCRATDPLQLVCHQTAGPCRVRRCHRTCARSCDYGVPDTGVARLARTTSDGSTQRVMSRGANKQTGPPDVALSLAIPENVSCVVAESRTTRQLCPGWTLTNVGRKSASRRSPGSPFRNSVCTDSPFTGGFSQEWWTRCAIWVSTTALTFLEGIFLLFLQHCGGAVVVESGLGDLAARVPFELDGHAALIFHLKGCVAPRKQLEIRCAGAA